ncbi:MAG: hypothetical protein AAF432_06530 [Planctomycetota bacterium]
MAWIHTIDPADADPPLAELYRRVGNPDGTVDHVMTVHGLNPDGLRAHFELYVSSMHRPSPLSRAEREMVAVTPHTLGLHFFSQALVTHLSQTPLAISAFTTRGLSSTHQSLC